MHLGPFAFDAWDRPSASTPAPNAHADDRVRLIQPDTGATREGVVAGEPTRLWIYLHDGPTTEAFSVRTGWQRGVASIGRAGAWRIYSVWRDGGWLGLAWPAGNVERVVAA